MDLSAVITQLKTYATVFNGQVAGAARFAGALDGQVWMAPLPAAYVIPLEEDAEPNDEENALFQIINERVGVVVEFDNSADRRGQGATLLFASTRASVFSALLNWRGLDPTHATRGLEADGGRLVDFDRGRLFYQWDFRLETQITDADGFQPTMQPLLTIQANADPGDPQPEFQVALPQT